MSDTPKGRGDFGTPWTGAEIVIAAIIAAVLVALAFALIEHANEIGGWILLALGITIGKLSEREGGPI